ncbi:MAG TPA: diguanylate cyclase [Povalibacter sp.]|nr:diguanylate cyclase [Povalibacter sp.]
MRRLNVRTLLAACVLLLSVWPWPTFASAADSVFDIRVLRADAPEPTAETLGEGSVDQQFEPFSSTRTHDGAARLWLQLRPTADFQPAAVAALSVLKSRGQPIELFAVRDGKSVPLQRATELPGFRGQHNALFILPDGLAKDQPLYARIEPVGGILGEPVFSAATLDDILAHGATHARMIALAFGALMAMSVAALLIWLVLSDRLLVLYATLFALQALYVAYLSGEGFNWPVLSLALPIASYSWNVAAALSGAVACLFVREIAELRHFSPRVYAIFGWLAVTFVVLAFANVAQVIGLGALVAAIGNLVFMGSAIFTLVVSWLAWRRNNRAAGWFLIAWGLLEAFTIATAIRLLLTDPEGAEGLLYYGLPLSMVAAAVLIALGVADRLRDQRQALTEAERRAQTDSLTGVLNRRSLVERLETACLRARARGLPIALLFIDLDHFKEINDSYGHQAGDACLRAIIGPIHSELRQSDVIGRYGGEEFVVILSSADVAAAEPIAERIRKRVAEVRIEGFGTPIGLTCSIGIATSDTLDVWGEHLIAHADAAVYAAKRSGRNRVQVAVPMAA